jgi:hypothetical protein
MADEEVAEINGLTVSRSVGRLLRVILKEALLARETTRERPAAAEGGPIKVGLYSQASRGVHNILSHLYDATEKFMPFELGRYPQHHPYVRRTIETVLDLYHEAEVSLHRGELVHALILVEQAEREIEGSRQLPL